MSEIEKKADAIKVVGELAVGMRVDGLDLSFWTNVVDPVASVIIKARRVLTPSEQATLMSIAVKAVHSAAHDARTSGVTMPLGVGEEIAA